MLDDGIRLLRPHYYGHILIFNFPKTVVHIGKYVLILLFYVKNNTYVIG